MMSGNPRRRIELAAGVTVGAVLLIGVGAGIYCLDKYLKRKRDNEDGDSSWDDTEVQDCKKENSSKQDPFPKIHSSTTTLIKNSLNWNREEDIVITDGDEYYDCLSDEDETTKFHKMVSTEDSFQQELDIQLEQQELSYADPKFLVKCSNDELKRGNESKAVLINFCTKRLYFDCLGLICPTW